MRIVGLVVLIALVGFFAAVGSGLGTFLNLPAVILIGVGTLALMMMSSEMSSWKSLFKILTLKGNEIGEEERAPLAALLAAGSRSALAMAVVGYIMIMTGMLQNMSDPSSIGPQMAVSMLPLLYGVLLSEFVFAPMHSRIAGGGGGSIPKLPKTGLGIVMFILVFNVLTLFMLLMTFSSVDELRVRQALGSLIGPF